MKKFKMEKIIYFLKELLEWVKNFINPISLILDLFEFVKKYKLMNQIFKSEDIIKKINSHNPETLRIDSLNRIYTVINFPEEVNNEKMRFQFLIMSYRNIDQTLIECGINDIIYPYSWRFGNYYLVIISPYTFHIDWKYISSRILCLFLYLSLFILMLKNL